MPPRRLQFRARHVPTIVRTAAAGGGLGCLLLVVGLLAASPAGARSLAASPAGAASTPDPERAVQMLNEWRAQVGVMAVSHDPVQSEGCRAHAEYYRQNEETGHYEDPSKPGYSEAGAKAAASSVLSYGGGDRGPFTWDNAVYHRTSLLNPRLATTGFWGEHSLGCMGVFGVDENRTAPVLTVHPYPYDGQQDVETTFACNEIPNPCNSVPGNDGSEPTGFIPSVQFNGPWEYIHGPEVTAAQLVPDGAAPVEITVEDRDSGQGGSLAGGLDLIPHSPLTEGTWYTASAEGLLEFSGEEFEEGGTAPFVVKWRFRTRLIPRDPDLQLDFVRGRPRVSSHSDAPVWLVIRQRRSIRRLTLPPSARPDGRYVAIAGVGLKSASWSVCATQPASSSGAWKGDSACQQGRPLRLRVTVLFSGDEMIRVRIKAPPAARGRRARVSMIARDGSVLDRARVLLRWRSRLDLRGPRGRRAKLRVSVRPFEKRKVPQRVKPAAIDLRQGDVRRSERGL